MSLSEVAGLRSGLPVGGDHLRGGGAHHGAALHCGVAAAHGGLALRGPADEPRAGRAGPPGAPRRGPHGAQEREPLRVHRGHDPRGAAVGRHGAAAGRAARALRAGAQPEAQGLGAGLQRALRGRLRGLRVHQHHAEHQGVALRSNLKWTEVRRFDGFSPSFSCVFHLNWTDMQVDNPIWKRQKTATGADSVRVRHILLRHQGVRQAMDLLDSVLFLWVLGCLRLLERALRCTEMDRNRGISGRVVAARQIPCFEETRAAVFRRPRRWL